MKIPRRTILGPRYGGFCAAFFSYVNIFVFKLIKFKMIKIILKGTIRSTRSGDNVPFF